MEVLVSSFQVWVCFPLGSRTSRRVGSGGAVGCASSHSNAKILKSNRRTYGRPVVVYQTEDEDDHEDDDEDEEEEDDEYSELEEFDDSLHTSRKRLGHYTRSEHRKRVTQRLPPKLGGSRSSKSKGSLKLAYTSDVESGKNTPNRKSEDIYPTRKGITEMSSSDDDGRGKKIAKFTDCKFQKLCEEVDLDERWFPLMEYLSTYGLKESDFILIFERHMPCLQINLASARERLEFLLSVGVKSRDIKRILLRQPQILEYTVENNLKPHVAFLTSLGVPDSRIGQIVTSAPSLFSYSIEHSLKPTVRYLVEEVGIRGDCVSKVVQLSPQILVQRIDNSWNSRLDFLSRELGAPRDNIVKMVTKHPQLLHYSIEDGIQPRINFLRSIGMRDPDILKVLTSLTQVLSLSLEANLKPKYLYLVNELHNEVQSLIKYPMYLSLSLEQRIRPRHRFLVSLKKAPKGPFPLSSLVPTDECFCQQWAGTSVDKYLSFRKSLLLREFAKKYEKKR